LKCHKAAELKWRIKRINSVIDPIGLAVLAAPLSLLIVLDSSGCGCDEISAKLVQSNDGSAASQYDGMSHSGDGICAIVENDIIE